MTELSEGRYLVIGMLGGAASPNRSKWFNTRAYWYSELARMVRDGECDIDLADEQLQEELLGIEYKQQTHGLGALLIESKDDMRKRGVGSPDYADAAVYAMADTTSLTGNPYAHLTPGETIAMDPREVAIERRSRVGYPV